MKPGVFLREMPRARIHKLKVAVVRKPWLFSKFKNTCELIDVSWGGVCMESDSLIASMGQRVDLEFSYDDARFPARGFVTRIARVGSARRFGVSFIYAPHQLERIISLFFRLNPQFSDAAPFMIDQVRLRQKEARIPFRGAEVHVKAESEENFVVCEVDNISRSGMGFYSPVKLGDAAPFQVVVKISDQSTFGLISGSVRYVAKNDHRYYFGMEYDQVPDTYLELLKQL